MTQEPTNESIQELLARINALEKTVKGLRIGIAGFMIPIFLFIISSLLHNVFDGRWVGIHNKDNKIKAWLDDSGLRLFGYEKNEDNFRSELTYDGLKLYDDNHVLRSEFNSNGFSFYDDKGKARAELILGTDHNPWLQFYNQDGGLSSEIIVDNDGLSHLLTFDKDGTQHGFPAGVQFDGVRKDKKSVEGNPISNQ